MKKYFKSHGHYDLTKGIIRRFWKKPLYKITDQIFRFGSNLVTPTTTPTQTPTPTLTPTNTNCNMGSLVFGANNKYISFAGDNDWALGTEDFCIEWWQHQTAASPPLYSRLFQVGDYPNHSIAVSIENGTFILWVNNGTQLYGGVSLANYLNQWVHFAVVRQSGTSSVYQNGTRIIINPRTSNDVTNNTDPLKIGFGSDNWWNGKITNFRWVKGSSVYDGTQTTITVPTSPLAAISGTKLLLLTNSAGTYLDDSSGLNKSATNNGDVIWSSDAPDFACCDKLTFVGVNANTTGNSAIKLPGGGWDGSAYSTETYTSPVSVKFRSSTTGNYLMGGFSYNPTGNPTTYLNTTYGLYIQNGFLEIYEYGGQVSVPGSISTLPTDIWRVEYNGTNVKYYQNDNLIYTSLNPVTQPLHVFFALLTGDQGVTDICVESIAPTPTATPTTPTLQPVDCVVSAWGAWSACDADCGGGTQTRTRSIVVAPANGGSTCPSLSESRGCNTQPCPPPPNCGCTDNTALNYDPSATCDDGSCTYCVYGCMDNTASNYNSDATCDDGSCTYCVYGCMDNTASNYNSIATCDDGSCAYCGCMDPTAVNYNSDATCDDGSCISCVYGCMDPNASNYNPDATCDDYSCNGSFGSSGFKWMRILRVDGNTAYGIGQNNITVSINQTGGGMFDSGYIYNAAAFPTEYGVPTSSSKAIANTKMGTFTATFSQPVKDPLVAFASVGNPGTSVPVLASTPFTPIWGINTTYDNPVNGTQYTKFIGTEGFNIIKLDGTVSSISFNYTVGEYYCNVLFGFVDQNVPTPTPTP